VAHGRAVGHGVHELDDGVVDDADGSSAEPGAGGSDGLRPKEELGTDLGGCVRPCTRTIIKT
jgi:hypothetical protein